MLVSGIVGVFVLLGYYGGWPVVLGAAAAGSIALGLSMLDG